MIPPFILIAILSFFVFYCIKVMITRGHDLHAMAFFTLYIYTIFAQIGYAYFPELSIFIGAYFGPTLFYKYWAFMFLSFFFSFLIYRKTNPLNDIKYVYRVKSTRRVYFQPLFFFITILLYLILSFFFHTHRELFGWGGGMPMGTVWFVLGFRMFTICTFFLYVLFRNKSNKLKIRRLSFLLFLSCIIFYLSVAFAAGTRSDILYFFVAIAFYELSPIINAIKYQKKKILIFAISGVFVINILMILLSLRTQTSNINFSSFLNFKSETNNTTSIALSNKILLQDYYSPSHTLFISMHYGFIDPIEAIKSNFSNSLILLKYPFLTQEILEKIGLKYERAEGWSYHIFVEGYNAVGWFGIIYNGIFWNLGMAFWCMLARSDNKGHNKAMLSILFFLIVNTMRSQTCAFIQSFWMILLPALGLFLLATNSRITLLKSAKTTRDNFN
jgi:hypothetical protein